MLYIYYSGNIYSIVKFLYYLFSFTPFLHNKTVVAIATFFCAITNKKESLFRLSLKYSIKHYFTVLAVSTIIENASGSLTAKLANIFLLIATSDFLRAFMNLE